MPQTQPVPLAPAGVTPAGTVSPTVTVPEVGPTSLPPPFETAIEYVSPLSPWWKLPLCDFAIASRASWTTVVGSDAVAHGSAAQPPPETEAEFVTDAAASAATSTVTVIAAYEPP